VKRDRIRDQKIINDYENEVRHLSSKMSELSEKEKQNESQRDSNMNIKIEVII
jgi:hypothetical protein